MNLLLATVAVAFAAFCVWLMVRVVNRRERWPKWTLAGVVGVPVLYVLSFGPACWINERTGIGYASGWGDNCILTAYRPILHWACKRPDGSEFVYWYAELGVRDRASLAINYIELPNGGWRPVAILWDRDD